MTGLEKMVNQILEEANASAKAKIEEANAKAAQIQQEGNEQAQALAREIARQTEAEVANYKERVQSSADLKRRTALLAARQEMIAKTIDKAYDSFSSMDDAAYFETLGKMLEKFARPEKGEILLSAADLGRLPSDFEAKVAEIAQKKGGELVLSKEGAKLDRGFVLVYGGIEENCSFKALFAAKKDELQDQVQNILFS